MSLVKLIWITPDAEKLIAYMARVSNAKNQDNPKIKGLLKYCIREGHWSIFEMCNLCIEINTTRAISSQILRHRSFSFQEFSQRYANPVEDLAFTTREARLQDTKNRQNSIDLDLENDEEDIKLDQQWRAKQDAVIMAADKAYRWAIDNGIAKEQARAVLPEGLMESRIYMNGTIRSWLHYIELRTGIETQKEHREVAVECGKVLSKIFPIMENFIEIQS